MPNGDRSDASVVGGGTVGGIDLGIGRNAVGKVR